MDKRIVLALGVLGFIPVALLIEKKMKDAAIERAKIKAENEEAVEVALEEAEKEVSSEVVEKADKSEAVL